MKIAGVDVAERDALELAISLRNGGMRELGDALEDALIEGAAEVTLDLSDQEAILRALEQDAPNHAYLVVALLSRIKDAAGSGSQPLQQQPAR